MNAPLYKAVDSASPRHAATGAAQPSDTVTRAKARERSQRTHGRAQSTEGNYDAPVKDALAQFDAEQQTKAKELLAKQREWTATR